MVDDLWDPDPNSDPFETNGGLELGQWQQILASDAELQVQATAQISLITGETVSLKNEGMAVWTAYPQAKTKGPALFYFQKGRVVANNADTAILHKLLSLAGKMKAKVVGGAGEEVYRLGHNGKVTVTRNHRFPVRRAWWEVSLS